MAGLYGSVSSIDFVIPSYCNLYKQTSSSSKANEIERMDLVGTVDGCDAIIVDDMVDTAGRFNVFLCLIGWICVVT